MTFAFAGNLCYLPPQRHRHDHPTISNFLEQRCTWRDGMVPLHDALYTLHKRHSQTTVLESFPISSSER